LLLAGDIVFEGATPAIKNATVRIQLHDVSRADAPSRIVAEQVLRNISLLPGNANVISFALDWPLELNLRASYILRAHVDMDGSGKVAAGDFVTTQSYPVDPRDSRTRSKLVVQKAD
jgi:uncharacterized lipoprotein YbaY